MIRAPDHGPIQEVAVHSKYVLVRAAELSDPSKDIYVDVRWYITVVPHSKLKQPTRV